MSERNQDVNHFTEETVRRYDEIAREYSNDWRSRLEVTELVKLTKFEKLVGSPPRKILDAGCGTGKHSVYFAEHGYDVCGIDMSSGMLKEATKNSVGLRINFVIGDMRSLNFPNDFFDGVWTVAAVAHLTPADKRRFIQEAHRVLRPSGILYIGAHNFFSTKHLIRLAKFYLSHLVRPNDHLIAKTKTVVAWAKTGYLFLDNRHWFYPRKSSLLKMLRETGFVVLASNSCFSKRLSIYAKKVVADPKGGS